jgi:hypothetical protein
MMEVRLWDIATGYCAMVELMYYKLTVSIDFDESILILLIKEMGRWILSPTPTPSPDFSINANIAPELPMVLVPIPDDKQLSISPVLSQYRRNYRTSWILDQQNRHILWAVPDWESYFHATNGVFTSSTGRVVIIDFRT